VACAAGERSDQLLQVVKTWYNNKHRLSPCWCYTKMVGCGFTISSPIFFETLPLAAAPTLLFLLAAFLNDQYHDGDQKCEHYDHEQGHKDAEYPF
jgi:hypothetical protein